MVAESVQGVCGMMGAVLEYRSTCGLTYDELILCKPSVDPVYTPERIHDWVWYWPCVVFRTENPFDIAVAHPIRPVVCAFPIVRVGIPNPVVVGEEGGVGPGDRQLIWEYGALTNAGAIAPPQTLDLVENLYTILVELRLDIPICKFECVRPVS